MIITRLRMILRRLLSDRNGNIAVIGAFSLPVIALVAGGAIDLHKASVVQQRVQDSLDAAVLAAAVDGSADAGEALLSAQLDGRPEIESWTAAFSNPGPNRTAGEASAEVPAAFLGLIRIRVLTVGAEAEAVVSAATPPCVTLLDPNASQALLMNSGARLTGRECEIHVHSAASNAAIFNSGSTLDVARVCVKSRSVLNNGGRPARLETGCEPVTDPFAARLPPPPSQACTHYGRPIDRGPVHFTPGVYCGGMNFNGRLDATFAPGLYVIKGGDWNVNGGLWQGRGVTFYFEDQSRIQFNSGIRAELSAPTSGPYQDYLFMEKPGLPKSQFIFNDSAGNRLEGVMYLPSRNVIYNSGSEAQGDRLNLVFNSLIVNRADWRLAPFPTAGGGGGAARLVR